MRHEILIVGRGGQGILLLGRILGLAASKYSGLYVTGSEAYASETRGGMSRVDLIIADSPEDIDYIRVRKANIVLFMFPYDLEGYARIMSDDAFIFLNSTYVKEHPYVTRRAFSVPYNEVAEQVVGTSRVSNIVALGHLVARTGVLGDKQVEEALKEIIPEKWLDLNMKALRAGLEIR